ncbi:MAG: hypothetical protein AAB728_01475 [Patescibacteria group bacterium]
MSRVGRIFASLYLLFGVAYLLITRSMPLSYAVAEDVRLQQAFNILLNIGGWPWNLAFLWGLPGSGYGYMGATLCVILVCVMGGLAYALDSALP